MGDDGETNASFHTETILGNQDSSVTRQPIEVFLNYIRETACTPCVVVCGMDLPEILIDFCPHTNHGK